MSVPPIADPLPYQPQLSFCSKLCQFTEIVTQTAIRVIFIAGSILMAASAFPLSFHAIAIPAVAFGATVLASFFFPQKRQISGPFFGALDPLVRPLAALTQVQAPGALPPDAPRGLINLNQNCAFNSLVHFLESDPQIAHWLRHPLTPEIDMPGFQNFLAGYHPTPRLMADFTAYAAAQNPPRPIPAMFADFIAGYVPPLEERRSFQTIEDAYRNINLLHGPYSHFLADYDQAVRENRFTLAGTQNLRLAINRITSAISPSENQQEDAPEILTPILNVLPDAHKVKIERATHLNVGEHPIPELPDATIRKQEECEYFKLSLKPGQQTDRLPEMFHRYCNEESDPNSSDGGVVRESADGQNRRYKPDRITVTLLEAPTALRFQIVRQAHEKGSSSWYNQLLPSWCPIIGDRQVKLETPVESPEEMTITLANGERKTYRLASFISHRGTTIKGGHYTACRIVNGQKYIMDDQSVTLADQQSWEERLQQAYLLCYLPVP